MFRCTTGEAHGRFSRWQVDNFHIAPKNATAKTCSERLGAGFLGGKTACITFHPRRAALRFGALALGIYAIGKAFAKTLQSTLDTPNIDEIAAQANNHVGKMRAPANSGAFLTQRLGAGPVHQRPHAADRAVEAGENRLANKEMADIQLDHFLDGGNRGDILEAEAMPGPDL